MALRVSCVSVCVKVVFRLPRKKEKRRADYSSRARRENSEWILYVYKTLILLTTYVLYLLAPRLAVANISNAKSLFP